MRSRCSMLSILVFVILGGLGWEPVASAQEAGEFKLPSGASEGDYFGQSVSIDGNYAIVGAGQQGGTGAAHIFKLSDNGWVHQQELTASDAEDNDGFGVSVSISGDHAIVGAYFNKISGISGSPGSAYIFTRSDDTWTEQKNLIASDAAGGDQFGLSVSVSAISLAYRVIVGAQYEDHNDFNSIGSAYVFEGSGSDWTEQAKLTASDGGEYEFFGTSVSISGDHAIVGANGDDDDGNNSGSAYIFTRSGDTWTEQKVTASDPDASDEFGYSVSIDGDNAIVGAWQAESQDGAAYIFKRSDASNVWDHHQKLVASGPSTFFGKSVFISDNYAVVGVADEKDENGDSFNGYASGSAYIFQRSEESWEKLKILRAYDALEQDAFGMSVSHSGEYTIVGAPYADDNGDYSGSAYIYSQAFSDIATSSFLTFGDVALAGGFATVIDSIKIKNTGTADLTVNPQNNMGGGFTVSPAQLTVAPGDSIMLAVGLSATTTGRRDASLVLTHNDASVGGQTTIAVHANVYERVKGRVVAWGLNTSGQTNVPEGLTDVIAIDGGSGFSTALKSDSTLVSWGSGWGTPPEDLNDVVAFSGGSEHSLALKSDGTLVAWGKNQYNQSDVPAGLTDIVAISAGWAFNLVLKSDGTVVAWGENQFGQANVPAGLTDVIAIEASRYHAMAIKLDSTVVAWGINLNGQINVPADLDSVLALAGGRYHTLALKSAGSVVAWGTNTKGQTDVPQGLENVTAIAAGWEHSVALKSDGTVVAWGDTTNGKTAVPGNLTEVVAITDGQYHTIALTTSEPSIATSPPSLSFGDVVLGSSSVDSVKVKNTGPLFSLSVSGGAVSGTDASKFTATPASLSIGPGDSAYVKVTFTPTSVGSDTASLQLTHNTAGSPTSIPLTGFGLGPVTLSLGTAFGASGDTLSIPVTLANPNTGHPVAGVQFDVVTAQPGWRTFLDTVNVPAGFSVSTNNIGDILRVVMYSENASKLEPAADTGLMTLRYVLTQGSPLGSTNVLSMADIEVADTLGVEFPDTFFGGRLQAGIRGDVNLDSAVSIMDIILNVRLIIGKDAMPDSGITAHKIADANGDTYVNIGDVIQQVNMILEIPPVTKPVASTSGPIAISLGDARIGPNGRQLMPVVIEGAGMISGLQVTFTYDPATVVIGGPVQTGDGLIWQHHAANGVYRLAGYSMAPGTGLRVSSAPAFWLPVTVTGEDGGSVTLTEVIMAGSAANIIPVTLGTTTAAVNRLAALPTAFSLSTATPNPFNPSTTIAYEVPEQTHVTLTIYNLLGQEVVRLMDQVQAAGRYEAVWNGTNLTGAGVASGIYLYRIVSGSGYTETKRMTLLK